jgi:hypothetical protein
MFLCLCHSLSPYPLQAHALLAFVDAADPPKAPTPYVKVFYTLVFSLRESMVLYPLFLCNTCRIQWFG